MQSIKCFSVVGGWQSGFELSGVLFGPVFNSITDLWQWQRDNIYI
jgi:hypothetical protein